MIGSPESATEGKAGARRRPRRPSAFSLTLTTITGIVLLLISVPNLGPAIRAGRADGTPGTFVAVQRACVRHLSHESCSWRGTFTSKDGRDRRRDSYLYGNVALNPGQRIAAIDVGRPDRVYTGPSREWILTALLLLLGAGLLVIPPARLVLVRRSLARFSSGG
jgi:hypothetical protein